MLVVDTETTVDRAQRLLFGIARSYRRARPYSPHRDDWHLRHEWIFHADDLEKKRVELLGAFCRRRSAMRAPPRLISRRSFVSGPLYKLAYAAEALLVGFNLPFDLSRLAVAASEARQGLREQSRRRATVGGFSLTVIDDYAGPDGSWLSNRYRPRIHIKTIDSKRHLIQFVAGRPDGRGPLNHGQFLDLRTLAFALTNKSHSLESACGAYNIPFLKRKVEHGQITPDYIDYCRDDVDATFQLALALLKDYDQHPISPDYRGAR